MKKLSLLIALTLLAGGIVLSPLTAKAQDEKQLEAERAWYDSCQQKKDDKCIPLSKELLEKYPTSQYAKFAKQKIQNDSLTKLSERFQAALKAYYAGPDAAKLDAVFASGDDYLKAQPGQPYFIGWMSLAGTNGAMGQFYKNLDKVKGYAETALKTFEPTTPPEGWKTEEWNPLRESVLAQMNQYLGWYVIETKGDQNQALNYLTKATQVKGKPPNDSIGWKDPTNYWLRSTIYGSQYEALKGEYDKLTDEEKNSDKGKEVRKKVNELLDTKLIPEYARVLVTATKPEAKDYYSNAKSQFDAFWKYRTDAPEKASDYVKNYAADPTINSVPIPAKAETADNSAAPTAPAPGASNVKLASGGSAATPGANGNSASNGNGSKSTPAKSKSTAKARKRRG